MILLKEAPVQPRGDAGDRGRAVAWGGVRLAPQDTVGAGLETGDIAGDELRSNRHRQIVDLELDSARKSQIHPERRDASDRGHAVRAAVSGKDGLAGEIIDIDARVRGKAEPQARSPDARR